MSERLAALAAEVEAARERVRLCEVQQAELRAANQAFNKAYAAYDAAADADRLASIRAGIVGRRVVGVEGMYGRPPHTASAHERIELEEARLVLDNGTVIEADCDHCDNAHLTVRKLPQAVSPAGQEADP